MAGRWITALTVEVRMTLRAPTSGQDRTVPN
jgi:hypothetical protein